MQPKIEKGVPVNRVSSHTKYPFANMEVGDSFHLEEYSIKAIRNVRTASINWRKYHKNDRRFLARKDGEGIRVWRVEDKA